MASIVHHRDTGSRRIVSTDKDVLTQKTALDARVGADGRITVTAFDFEGDDIVYVDLKPEYAVALATFLLVAADNTATWAEREEHG